jgi:hypothetical protein
MPAYTEPKTPSLAEDLETLGDFLRRQYHDVMSPDAERALADREHLLEAATLLERHIREGHDAGLFVTGARDRWWRAERARKGKP